MLKSFAALICSFVLMCGCTNRPKVDTNLVYSSLNQVIQQDSLFARIVCAKFDQISIPDNILKEFFDNDRAYIDDEIKASKNFSIDPGQLYFFSKRKGIIEKSSIDTTCSQGIFYRFSYPIFSRDLQTVVVMVTEDCSNMLCGQGYKVIYRKKNGKWVQLKKYDEWIS